MSDAVSPLSRQLLGNISILMIISLSSLTSANASHVRRMLSAVSQDGPEPLSGAVLAATVSAILSVVVILGFLAVIAWRRHHYHGGEDSSDVEEGVKAKAKAKGAQAKAGESEDSEISTLRCLTFNDIQVATEGFKAENVLSDKPHSSVHVAEGPNHEKWAVKRAKGASIIGEHLFGNEVDFLAKVTHSNILPFEAYCDDNNEQILIFEYMPNGSLASWLRPPPEDADRQPLTFEARIEIAMGVAEALCFLHSFSKPTIIHRDVVSDSILLDSEFKAKLGSLGLLKHLPGEGLWMRMAQKKGYLDPEYFQTFKVTAKCDVYSFGVVLLELLTGCPPVIQVTRAETHRPMTLPQWALQTMAGGNIQELLDPRVPRTEGGFSMHTAEKFAQIACDCVAPLRKNRPEMLHVAASLRALKAPSEVSQRRPSFLTRFVQGTNQRVAPSI